MKLRLAGLADPLYDGSVALGHRIGAWITAPKYRSLPDDAPEGAEPVRDERAPLKRVAGLGGVAYVLAVSDYTTYAVAAGTLGWVVAALALSQGHDLTEPEEPSPVLAEAPSEYPDSSPVALDNGLIPAAVRHLAAGGHGAHLAAVAGLLSEGTREAWTPGRIRSACAAAGIPVTSSVRQPGRGVSTGVRVEDLPDPSPSPSPAPVVAVVVAGQDAPTGPATATPTGPQLRPHAEGGDAVAIIDDPSETRHYTVRSIHQEDHMNQQQAIEAAARAVIEHGGSPCRTDPRIPMAAIDEALILGATREDIDVEVQRQRAGY
ncbi:hypothetical protein [Streptomyces sp. NPDC056387]|uniref:hypothetical protein n=1 Tax=Streptomyces sp. NPDC056387 TaxID=3345803 RepID=UPI0035DCEF48